MTVIPKNIPSEKMVLTKVTFAYMTKDWREASIKWRRAIGFIPSLNGSIAGGKPLCAAEFGIDLQRHAQVRKFFDQASLKVLRDYLQEVIKTTPDPHPVLTELPGGGFRYQVSTGRAEISVEMKHGIIAVTGWAHFKDPRIAVKNLRKDDFTVGEEETSMPVEPVGGGAASNNASRTPVRGGGIKE